MVDDFRDSHVVSREWDDVVIKVRNRARYSGVSEKERRLTHLLHRQRVHAHTRCPCRTRECSVMAELREGDAR